MNGAPWYLFQVELSWTRAETYEVSAPDEDDAIMRAIRLARQLDDAAEDVTVEDIFMRNGAA